MALRPRYTVAINFREQDRPLLDAAVQIAKDEASDLTGIMREALRQYTKSKLKSGNIKMDEFLDHVVTDPIFGTVLSPTKLRGWADTDLLHFAKLVRGRKQELESELKKRGFHFVW
jgi:hypothetical protein